jgi:hypothetical protein
VSVMVTGGIDTVNRAITKKNINQAIESALLANKPFFIGKTNRNIFEEIIKFNVPVDATGKTSLIRSLKVTQKITGQNSGLRTVNLSVEAVVKRNLSESLMSLVVPSPSSGMQKEIDGYKAAAASYRQQAAALNNPKAAAKFTALAAQQESLADALQSQLDQLKSGDILIKQTLTAKPLYLPIELMFVVDAGRFIDAQGRAQSVATYFQNLMTNPNNRISPYLQKLTSLGVPLRIGLIPYTNTVNVGTLIKNNYIRNGAGSLYSPTYGCLEEWWDRHNLADGSSNFNAYRNYLYVNDWPFPGFPQRSGEWGHHGCSATKFMPLGSIQIKHPLSIGIDVPTTRTSAAGDQEPQARDWWGSSLPHLGLLWAARYFFQPAFWSLSSSQSPSKNNVKKMIVLISGTPMGVQFPVQDLPEWNTGLPYYVLGIRASFSSFTNINAYSAYGYPADPRQVVFDLMMSGFLSFGLGVAAQNYLNDMARLAETRKMHGRFKSACDQLISRASTQKLSLYSLVFRASSSDRGIPADEHLNLVRACTTDPNFTGRAIIETAPGQNPAATLESRLLEILNNLQGDFYLAIS